MAKKKARGRKKATSKKRASRTSAKRSSPIGTMSTTELERELSRRQAMARRLERRRDHLAEQLEEVDRELAALGGLGGISIGGVRKRPRNDMNLAESLAKVLKTKTMSVTEVSEAVQKAGYRTSAANFRTIVNQTLIKDKRFKKVSRGRYTAA